MRQPASDRRGYRPLAAGLLAALLLFLLAPTASAAVDTGPANSGQQLSEREQRRLHARERERSQLVAEAGQAYAQQDWDRAERLARRAAGIDRAHPDGLTLLAMVHSAQGRAEQAGQAYQQALALAPLRGDLLNNYGAWLCAQDQPAEALVLFDRGLRDPGGPQADLLTNAGICAWKSGQWERAERDLRQALEFYPQHPQLLLSMASLQYQRGHTMAARAFYQRRLAAAPADISVLQLAVQVEEQLGDRAAAELHELRLEQALAADQDAEGRLIDGDH